MTFAAILATLLSSNPNLAAAAGNGSGSEPVKDACTNSAGNPDCPMTTKAAQDSAGAAVSIGAAETPVTASRACGARIYPDCLGNDMSR